MKQTEKRKKKIQFRELPETEHNTFIEHLIRKCIVGFFYLIFNSISSMFFPSLALSCFWRNFICFVVHMLHSTTIYRTLDLKNMPHMNALAFPILSPLLFRPFVWGSRRKSEIRFGEESVVGLLFFPIEYWIVSVFIEMEVNFYRFILIDWCKSWTMKTKQNIEQFH